MADAEQKETDQVRILAWSAFLESYPVNTAQQVSDYYGPAPKGGGGARSFLRRSPVLRLYCTKCNGVRNFAGTWDPYFTAEFTDLDTYENLFLRYTCRDCGAGYKVFCLRCQAQSSPPSFGLVVKIGEYPDSHLELPRSLQPLLGDNYGLFVKGLKCEKQRLGLAAFTYYRRVVESQKTELIQAILEVAKKLNAPRESLDALHQAAREKQFARAVETIKDAIPQSLLVDSNNPLKFLHNALSVGVHNQTDEDCLKIAHGVRLVLADFSERLKLALADQAELRAAIGSIAKFVGDAKKNSSG